MKCLYQILLLSLVFWCTGGFTTFPANGDQCRRRTALDWHEEVQHHNYRSLQRRPSKLKGLIRSLRKKAHSKFVKPIAFAATVTLAGQLELPRSLHTEESANILIPREATYRHGLELWTSSEPPQPSSTCLEYPSVLEPANAIQTVNLFGKKVAVKPPVPSTAEQKIQRKKKGVVMVAAGAGTLIGLSFFGQDGQANKKQNLRSVIKVNESKEKTKEIDPPVVVEVTKEQEAPTQIQEEAPSVTPQVNSSSPSPPLPTEGNKVDESEEEETKPEPKLPLSTLTSEDVKEREKKRIRELLGVGTEEGVDDGEGIKTGGESIPRSTLTAEEVKEREKERIRTLLSETPKARPQPMVISSATPSKPTTNPFPKETDAIAEKYAALPLEERAYQILKDLGMTGDSSI